MTLSAPWPSSVAARLAARALARLLGALGAFALPVAGAAPASSAGPEPTGNRAMPDLAPTLLWVKPGTCTMVRPPDEPNQAPNARGLHDLSGHVLEWCLDWSGDHPRSAETNPAGPDSGHFRMARRQLADEKRGRPFRRPSRRFAGAARLSAGLPPRLHRCPIAAGPLRPGITTRSGATSS